MPLLRPFLLLNINQCISMQYKHEEMPLTTIRRLLSPPSSPEGAKHQVDQWRSGHRRRPGGAPPWASGSGESSKSALSAPRKHLTFRPSSIGRTDEVQRVGEEDTPRQRNGVWATLVSKGCMRGLRWFRNKTPKDAERTC